MRETSVWAVTLSFDGDEEYFVVAPSFGRASDMARRLAYDLAAQRSVYREIEVTSVTKKMEAFVEGEE